MIPVELKFSISYKLVVICVSTVERETGPFKVSKHGVVLREIIPSKQGTISEPVGTCHTGS